MQYSIECKAIQKFFGSGDQRIEVLKSIDLQVKKAEFLMLVGPSGCGKTTLISILAGILPFDRGSCVVEGNSLGNLSETELIEFRAKNIGFVFQSYNLIPTITVEENVAIPLIIAGMDRIQACREARSTLAAVELEDKATLRPNLLSGGQQQRVAIARALVHKPRLIICDEPTSALDFHTGERIVNLLRKVNKDLGCTFVAVTHDNRILKFADRVVYLDDGVIKGERYAEENA